MGNFWKPVGLHLLQHKVPLTAAAREQNNDALRKQVFPRLNERKTKNYSQLDNQQQQQH